MSTPLNASASSAGALISNATFEVTAIAIDANVFLRLSTHPKAADIIDYLTSAHTAPVILPGQVIQEFWNNQLQAVDSIASGLRKRFEQIRSDVEKIDGSFGDFADEFQDLTTRFSDEFGYAYDESTVRRTQQLLDVIKTRATVSFCSRPRFAEIALNRKRTKTPPGFRDDGDGDFFVWIDLLFALHIAKSAGQAFSRVALISHDKKIDWMREGTPHPILIAEMRALFDVPFEILSLQQLSQEVSAAT